MSKSINYSAAGVNYNVLDPVKKLAQNLGKQTVKNFPEVAASRGESAYVWEEEDCYRAFVIEGLGTKNLVADAMGKSYETIAQDTVASIVNDILTVGALPQVVNAYFATGSPEWFNDTVRSTALVEGWAKACNMAGATWGGGETPGLSGIINPETVDLAGACIGIIRPKERLILGDKLRSGDAIILIESSGIHANGLSLARKIADGLPDGYATELSGGLSYGDALLTPTHIYATLIKELFGEEIDVHYMVNITGHGFRKLMRANREFSYIINQLPPVPPLFDFLKKHSGNDDLEMYGNFNMGAGFAIFLPADQVDKAMEIATKNGFKSWNAGVVQNGPKRVIIEPKNIAFEADSLGVR